MIKSFSEALYESIPKKIMRIIITEFSFILIAVLNIKVDPLFCLKSFYAAPKPTGLRQG